MELQKTQREIFINETHLYLVRYCDKEFVSFIENFIMKIYDFPFKSDKSYKEQVLKSPHILIYDHKKHFDNFFNEIFKDKPQSFKKGFSVNFLRFIRGTYIDTVVNGKMDYPSKIQSGNFFVNLIDNISSIEGINLDEDFKFRDYINSETDRLEAEMKSKLKNILGQIEAPAEIETLDKILCRKTPEELAIIIQNKIESGLIKRRSETVELCYTCFYFEGNDRKSNHKLQFLQPEKEMLLFFQELARQKIIAHSDLTEELLKLICLNCINKKGNPYKVKQLKTVIAYFGLIPNKKSC